MRLTPPSAVLASSIFALALAGCGAAPAATQASASQRPVSGGTAVYALPPDTAPNWFVPLASLTAASVVNSQTTQMMYKPLLSFNRHDQFDPRHSLASSVTWNAQDTVFTVRLNPKWHWSNGQPVTAQDVVFTWSVMKAASEPNTHYPWTFAGQGFGGVPSVWRSVTATNAHTVTIALTEPRNPEWFIRNGIGQIVPMPASVWNRFPNSKSQEMAFISRVANSPTNPVYRVVDGPFQFQSTEANNYWSFVPNPRYDGHRAYLKRVVFQYETSTASEFASLKTGSINVGYLGVSLLTAKSQLTNDVVTVAYPLGFNYLILNMNSKAPHGIGTAFQSLAVRQALQLGVDQQGIIQHIFHGYGTVDDTTLAPQPHTAFLDPRLVSHNPYPFNPRRGQKLLEDAGWHEVGGVMTKHGVRLSFTLDYASGSHSSTDMASLMKADWAKEGIQVHLEAQPFNTVISDSPANASQWAAMDWQQGNMGGWSYQPYPTGGGLFGTAGAMNSGSYSSSQMDQFIQATYEPSTPNQAMKRLYAYEDYAAKQLPSAIFLPYEPLFNVHAANIHGTVSTFDPIGNMIHPNYWWISR